jgi:hypothetical protein
MDVAVHACRQSLISGLIFDSRSREVLGPMETMQCTLFTFPLTLSSVANPRVPEYRSIRDWIH